jgi:hypothetical protein
MMLFLTWQFAKPEKVKEKWAGLIHGCQREIEKWERSGQGNNNKDDEDGGGGQGERVFGSLKNCSQRQRALDSRSSFFVNKQPYFIIFVGGIGEP